MSDDEISMRKRIKQARVVAGLSQKQLATKLHVSQSQITRWEGGHAVPSPRNLAKLSKALKVSVGYLKGGVSKGGVLDINTLSLRTAGHIRDQARRQGLPVDQVMRQLLDAGTVDRLTKDERSLLEQTVEVLDGPTGKQLPDIKLMKWLIRECASQLELSV